MTQHVQEKCLRCLLSSAIALYVEITSTKTFGRIFSWVKSYVVNSKKGCSQPFAVALKKAGTGKVGHQQAEIEILHCHVVEHKNLSFLCEI